jgi:hypothetical protein
MKKTIFYFIKTIECLKNIYYKKYSKEDEETIEHFTEFCIDTLKDISNESTRNN